jgi:hypothetical protein
MTTRRMEKLKAMRGAAQEEPPAKETQKPTPDGAADLKEKKRKAVHLEDPPETGEASSSTATASAEESAPQGMEPPSSDEGPTASKQPLETADSDEDMRRPQPPRPRHRIWGKRNFTPEEQGIPAKHSRIEDVGFVNTLDDLDSPVMHLEDALRNYTHEEDLQAKHKELEQLMSYDNFKRTSSKESTMDFTWVTAIGSCEELKA